MIVSHIFAKSQELGPISEADLYQYVVAANGIFLRAERPGLKVQIWLQPVHPLIRGLVELKNSVRMTEKRVPARITAQMVEMAYRARGREILYYLEPQPWKYIGVGYVNSSQVRVETQPANPWRLSVPEQVATNVSVRPVDESAGANALIEVHSHHAMTPIFSIIDDHDEQGFRIYAVLGNLLSTPTIYVRVGVYGHFFTIPAHLVFELPVGLVDAFLPREAYGH